jgi:hypothetical protein
MSDNTAILAGFTKEILASAADMDLHLFVQPSADFDDAFKAYDADECEWIVVNGWLFDIEVIDE